MANTVISPNMNLPVPVVGTDAGPDWATNYNACLSAIDSHNHTTGQGVQITPAGININTDLPFGNNNLTTVRSVNFTAQGSPLALAGDLGCVYVSGVDLYYNDENGNQVRITQSGSVTGATGTITGLPSGTASASYSAGTFTFQGATNTPATMAVGPIITGAAIVSPHTVTLSAANALAADYGMVWPLALPAVTSAMQSDTSGNLSFLPLAGTTYAPTLVWSHNPTINSSSFWYTRVGSVINVYGVMNITGASGTSNLTSITIPVATATLVLLGNTNLPGTATTSDLTASGGVAANFSSIGYASGVTGPIAWRFSYLVN